MLLASFLKISWLYMWGYISVLYVLFNWSVYLFLYHWNSYPVLIVITVINFKVREYEFSSFILPFQGCFGHLIPLRFHVNVEMDFSISVKKIIRWDCIVLLDCFGSLTSKHFILLVLLHSLFLSSVLLVLCRRLLTEYKVFWVYSLWSLSAT